MHIGSVVIDCNDFVTMSAFWAEALHYVPREPAEEDWVVLRDPEGVNVNVSLQQVPESASGKNRLHFDLYTTDPEGEIDRLLGSAPRAIRGSRSRTKTSSSSPTRRAISSA